jgi:hypothetical protein
MKTIYISGKITGDPGYYEKFREEANRLASLGYEPVNPALRKLEGLTWEETMKVTIAMMLACHGVSLLSDWKESRGAQIEERLARELGIEVRDWDKWQGGAL